MRYSLCDTILEKILSLNRSTKSARHRVDDNTERARTYFGHSSYHRGHHDYMPFFFYSCQKNPRAHKNRIGTPPPKPKMPLPPKTRNFMDMEVFLRKERISSRRPSNWRSHFRPQNCGHEFYLSTTKTPQTVTLQVTILCQQISKKKQHAPEHSFALTLCRSFVTIFWQKNLTKLQLAVLPFAVF